MSKYIFTNFDKISIFFKTTLAGLHHFKNIGNSYHSVLFKTNDYSANTLIKNTFAT